MKITIGPRSDCKMAVELYNATHIFSIQEGMERFGRKLKTPKGIVGHHHFFLMT